MKHLNIAKLLADNENSAEHHVAMDVNGLCASVLSLMGHARTEATLPFVLNDRPAIEDAYVQLGRLLVRLGEATNA